MRGQLVATPVATAVAAVSALIGLAPWLASGARLPVQNLWAKATAPDDMPLALLPISQYATTTIVALLLTGAALGGLAVRVLRKGTDGARRPLIGGAVGLSAVQLLAIGQSFWVVAEGHGLLDDTADPRAHLYVGALLAGALLTWLVALTVHALTASRRRGRVHRRSRPCSRNPRRSRSPNRPARNRRSRPKCSRRRPCSTTTRSTRKRSPSVPSRRRNRKNNRNQKGIVPCGI